MKHSTKQPKSASQYNAGFLRVVAGLACLPIFGTTSAHGQIPCRYEVAHVIQGPPCTSGGNSTTIGTAISPNGQFVVGWYRQCGFSEDRAFIYDTTTQQFSLIPMPPGIYAASAADVNDAGVVVGTSLRTNIGQRGFMYTISSGQWMEFPPLPGGVWSGATGVNSSGTVCGWRSVGPGINPQTAFIWTPQNGFTDLGLTNGLSTGAKDINENGDVLGWNGDGLFAPNTRVFLYRRGITTVFGPVPNGLNSIPQSINYSGQFLYYGQLASGGPTYPFVWDRGSSLSLPPLVGYDLAAASCLSDAGIAMGRSRTSGTQPEFRPTFWINGAPGDFIPHYPPDPELALNGPVAVNLLGELIVYRDNHSVVLAAIPAALGDTNCDGQVNINDLLNIIYAWGPCSRCDEDFNGDGVVDLQDLFVVIHHWSI